MTHLMRMTPDEIKRGMVAGEVTVTQVGLGWMGLPTACLFAESGAKVVGADVNSDVVDIVNRGESPLAEKGLGPMIKRHVRAGQLKATTNVAEAASHGDVVSIIVPTLVDKQKRADYSAVENACREIGKGLQEESLILFQSTCGPGVTERVVKGTVEKHSGLKAGEGFGLAYSPIRAMGGRALRDIPSYARILGGHDERSVEAAAAVMAGFTKGELTRVRDMKTAEAVKLFETIYRDVNIALANEFASFCEEAGIDYAEAREAANSQPYSHLHSTGAGVGGHCLPLYPYFLLSEAQDVKLRLLRKAREVNDEMPRHVIRLASSGLKSVGKSMRGAKATLLGLSYRANVKEARFSPALEILSLLKRRGARLRVFDPHFNSVEMKRMGYEGEHTLKKALERADLVIITVAHDEFSTLTPQELAASTGKSTVVVDCVQILDPAASEKSGLVYRGVGRGIWRR